MYLETVVSFSLSSTETVSTSESNCSKKLLIDSISLFEIVSVVNNILFTLLGYLLCIYKVFIFLKIAFFDAFCEVL